MKMATQTREGYILHKGYMNVPDTTIYVLGFVLIAVGTIIGVLAIRSSSQTIMAVGLAILWLGILLCWFSGWLGNRWVPEGFGRQQQQGPPARGNENKPLNNQFHFYFQPIC